MYKYRKELKTSSSSEDYTYEAEVSFSVDITVEDGGWEYEDEREFAWLDFDADETNEKYPYYVDENGVFLGYRPDIVEDLDQLFEDMLPSTDGVYHIEGTAALAFDISGAVKETSGYSEEDEIVKYDIDRAKATFNLDESSIKDLTITEL